MIKAILWDIDGTILDFKQAEYYGMKICFVHFGLGECTDEMIQRYSDINNKYWELLELGEIEKEKVFTERFREFFETEGIAFTKFEEFHLEYRRQLKDIVIFRDKGYDLIKELKGQIRQYAVTNGSYSVQKYKLEKAGLKELFDDCFISDQIGVEKPNVEFFNHVKKSIGDIKDSEMIIVGDSLTSDMKGGNNAGILCCWYNPFEKENTKGVKIDYEIKSLWDVKKIIFDNK